jgi:hypothetical protein
MDFRLILTYLLIAIVLTNTADYSNLQDWSGQCNQGHSQSPINFITSDVVLCGNSRFRLSMWNGTTTIRPGLGSHSSLKSGYPSSVMTIVD